MGSKESIIVCNFAAKSIVMLALSPVFVFLCLYLVTSIIVQDFYKVPIIVAFLVSSIYAIAITKGSIKS